MRARRRHHRHPRELAGARRPPWPRIDELDVDGLYCGGDLVGYGPHPNEVCALIAQRAIPTIYGNYDYAIARDLEDCGCAYVTRTTASSGSARSTGRCAHRSGEQGLHARPAVRPALRRGRDGRAPRPRLAPQGQREPLRVQTGAPVPAPRRGRGGGRAGLRYTHKPWIHGVRRRAVRQLRLGGQAQGRRSARAFAVLEADAPAASSTIERVEYDAAAVAQEVAAAGLPAEFADKLVLAARTRRPAASQSSFGNGDGEATPLTGRTAWGATGRARASSRAPKRAARSSLLAATVAALLWANSPWPDSYESVWTTELSIRLGDWALTADLREWVNDGLMTFFFLVVGLEAKRELDLGELRDRKRLALPVVAALGRHDRPRRHLPGVQCRRDGCPRLGRGDVDGHGLRARAAGAGGAARRDPSARLPAHPRGGRRPLAPCSSSPPRTASTSP